MGTAGSAVLLPGVTRRISRSAVPLVPSPSFRSAAGGIMLSVGFVLTNGGRIQDYWGVGKATKQMLPLIAIPTTAGTGSECQSFALIADEETHASALVFQDFVLHGSVVVAN